MNLKQWIAIGLWTLMGAARAQFDASTPIIVVNGESISGIEYARRMEVLPGVGSMVNGSFAEAPPGFLTLIRMIEERLLLQLAKDKGVYPTDAEVKAEMDAKFKENPKMLEGLKLLGATDADIMFRTRIDMAEFKLQTMGVIITDQQVDKYYADNVKLFQSPKRYKVRILVVREAGKDAADADLKAGMKFEDAVKKHSVDSSKEIGGMLGEMAESMFGEPLKGMIQNTKIGAYTDWNKASDTFVRFYVEDIIPEKTQPLDVPFRRNLRRQMMLDAGAKKNDLNKWMTDIRAKANVEIKNTRFGDDIKKYMTAAKGGGN